MKLQQSTYVLGSYMDTLMAAQLFQISAGYGKYIAQVWIQRPCHIFKAIHWSADVAQLFSTSSLPSTYNDTYRTYLNVFKLVGTG